MNLFHTDLQDRWNTFTIHEQMANIGAEVGRSINWKKKNNTVMSINALYRALELIDLTLEDPKHKQVLSELTKMRELLIDYSIGDNIYKSTDKGWSAYFYPFNYAARIDK